MWIFSVIALEDLLKPSLPIAFIELFSEMNRLDGQEQLCGRI